MTIKQYITWLTNYRDNLIKFLQLRLEDLSKVNTDPVDIPEPLLTIKNVRRILNEIELCNHYINYLHVWEVHYTEPTIPIDNREIFKNIEQLILQNPK